MSTQVSLTTCDSFIHQEDLYFHNPYADIHATLETISSAKSKL
jgi:hypothetical protein